MTDLLEILQVNPSLIDIISTKTPVKLNKFIVNCGRKEENNHFGQVSKLSSMKVSIGRNYQDLVNERLKQEGKDASFVSNKRKWGTRIGESCLIEHKGNLYVEVIVDKCESTKYVIYKNVIPKNMVNGLPSSYAQNESSQGGLDDKIIIRTIRMDNIQSFTVKRVNVLFESCVNGKIEQEDFQYEASSFEEGFKQHIIDEDIYDINEVMGRMNGNCVGGSWTCEEVDDSLVYEWNTSAGFSRYTVTQILSY